MSLTSPRLIRPLATLPFAALAIASCSQESAPTAPSSSLTGAPQPTVQEYVVTLFDSTPLSRETSVSREVPPDRTPDSAPAPEPPYEPGSATTPWPPGPPPQAEPGVPMPTPPTLQDRFILKIDPEPVRHSGTPIPIAACRDLKYTWYYDQILHNQSGIPVEFTERENFFDARFVSRSTETIALAGNGTTVLHTRWCSGHAKPHYAQSRFKGRDRDGAEVIVSGPWVRLLSP
jgi:hypothetical protein